MKQTYKIEPSHQGDVDYEDLLEETVEEFMVFIKRVAGEGKKDKNDGLGFGR